MPISEPPDGFLTAQQLADRWTTHVTTVHRWNRSLHGFPTPLRAPGKPNLWAIAGIQAWEKRFGPSAASNVERRSAELDAIEKDMAADTKDPDLRRRVNALAGISERQQTQIKALERDYAAVIVRIEALET